MTAFMLNVFGKNDSQDFRMILSCHHLEPQAAILGLTNEASNIYNFLNHILFFLNIMFTGQERNIYSI